MSEEGFAGIKAGPGNAGGRAHERSIMVFAALAQLQSGTVSTRRSVGKLSLYVCSKAYIQAVIRFSPTTTGRSLRPGCAAEMGTPQSLDLLCLDSIVAWARPVRERRHNGQSGRSGLSWVNT